MLFNSVDFMLFLPACFILYWLIPAERIQLRNSFLVLSSYFFYGWWDWRFLSLIIGSTLVDFIVGLKLAGTESESYRKTLLGISLAVNIGVLAIFKYLNFFLESLQEAFTLFGSSIAVDQLTILLPVGISFYTFQTLSYTIDVYRRRLEPSRNLEDFAAFVSFFPQLVAGPIERATHLLPQFQTVRHLTVESVKAGGKAIIAGFFLKLVIADRAAIYVNSVYNNVDYHDGLTFLAATVAFAFQIYGDFAGYSLIAIGTAKLFDFDLMVNFRRPYFSGSVTEFWSRWHISLSTWFRDYVYIPLGGSRTSRPRWMANLMVTFLVSGLWHGASWTFVIWGALNGLYVVAERCLPQSLAPPRIIRVGITFTFICLAWIFFRANSLADAETILSDIFMRPGELFIGRGADVITPVYATFAIMGLLIVESVHELGHRIAAHGRFSEMINMGLYALLMFLILYLGVFEGGQFIYFQF